MVWLTSMRRDAHFSIVLETESVRVRVSAMDMGIVSFQHLWFSVSSDRGVFGSQRLRVQF